MRTLILILAILFLAGNTEARGSRSHGSGGGHYKGGRGSSHKGGSYKRKSTNDHYRLRK